MAMKKTDLAIQKLDDAQDLCPKEHLADTAYQAGLACLRQGRIDEVSRTAMQPLLVLNATA
jgi:hypothetical protein